MRLLLDTHALLWWFTDDERLSEPARAAIGDEANQVFVSAASALEIATKHRLGKLAGLGAAITRFDELVAADGFEHLPIRHYHALKAGGYVQPHADPVDRMLAAQCELEDLQIVSCDHVFTALFGVKALW